MRALKFVFIATALFGCGDSSSAMDADAALPGNTTPTADPQTLTTNEDTDLALVLSGIDAESDPLSFQVTGQPNLGTLLGTPPNLTYRPNADENGADSFSFTVSDGESESVAATISIAITPVDDPPIANDDAINLAEDDSGSVSAGSGGVLDNDSDIDSSLSVSAFDATSAQGIAVTVNADGSFTYDTSSLTVQSLAAGQNLNDSFQYTASGDGVMDGATASVVVNGANDAPVANADTNAVNENVVLAGSGLLDNDSDIDTGDTIQAVAATGTSAQGASYSVAIDGSYTYDPTGSTTLRALESGDVLVDTFSYTVQDSNSALSSPATVSITVSGDSRGRDGNVTISTAGTSVNAYTVLTADAAAGAMAITVADNSLAQNFAQSLAAGDLILIYQAQGAALTGSPPNDHTWGDIAAYNGAGHWEFVEVSAVTGGTGITVACGLTHSYSASGGAQIVRVLRADTLTVQSGASISAPSWNGLTGGIVAVEVLNALNLSGTIDASAAGFRGGAVDNLSGFSPNWRSSLPEHGAEKGESIVGDVVDYDSLEGRYCRGAAANGGGGGNAHNGGGGGGANTAPNGVTWTGFGVVDPVYNAAWALEAGYLPNHASAGGGKGGYTFSSSNQDALSVGPSNSAWGGDWRRPYGGQGGRSLDTTDDRVFFGGGGGAGDGDNGDSGAGGAGGGAVFVVAFGPLSGDGSVVASGQSGEDTDASNPPFGGLAGNDGAGGGGGGGSILISSASTIPSDWSLSAQGGDGGDQLLAAGAFGTISEAQGPGGGGGGGLIAFSSGTPTISIAGGNNGITQSPHLTEFPPNGATRGGPGTSSATLADPATLVCE